MKSSFNAPKVEIRAKERLTGAVILVALVVLLVPELLSGPRHVAPRSAPAAGEPPMVSYTVRLDDGSGSPAGQPGAAARLGAAQPKAPPLPETGPQPLAATAPPPETSPQQPAATAPHSEKPARPSAAAPHREAQRTASAAAASAKRPGTGAAAPAGWQVQVGSFDTREHAERLARGLKLKGFSVSVSQSMSQGRRWFRVRVGPERDRTAALAVARRLHAAGQAAVVQRP